MISPASVGALPMTLSKAVMWGRGGVEEGLREENWRGFARVLT